MIRACSSKLVVVIFWRLVPKLVVIAASFRRGGISGHLLLLHLSVPVGVRLGRPLLVLLLLLLLPSGQSVCVKGTAAVVDCVVP